MTGLVHRFGVLLVLGATVTLVAAASGYPPTYVAQWGSLGSGDGQFNAPYGVATDASGTHISTVSLLSLQS